MYLVLSRVWNDRNIAFQKPQVLPSDVRLTSTLQWNKNIYFFFLSDQYFSQPPWLLGKNCTVTIFHKGYKDKTLSSEMIAIVGSANIDAKRAVQHVTAPMDKWTSTLIDKGCMWNVGALPGAVCLLPELNDSQLSCRSTTWLPQQLGPRSSAEFGWALKFRFRFVCFCCCCCFNLATMTNTGLMLW